MGDKSKINWCDATWNPVTGCTKISTGCMNCYAEKMAERLQAMGAGRYKDGFAVRCHEEVLQAPLFWKRPRRIFVNSMSDLFHDDVPFEFIDMVFAIMAMATRHTFMILTKRPRRMKEYMTRYDNIKPVKEAWASLLSSMFYRMTGNEEAECIVSNKINGCLGKGFNAGWPLRNVWLGVTVENRLASERIGVLLDTPAARRFVSCEPLLECVPLPSKVTLREDGNGIDWIIVGGESGAKARPLEISWVRLLRSQTKHIGSAFFFKQFGRAFDFDSLFHKGEPRLHNGLPILDGVTHGEFPSIVEDRIDESCDGIYPCKKCPSCTEKFVVDLEH